MLFIILCFCANNWFQTHYCCEAIELVTKEEFISVQKTGQSEPIVSKWGKPDAIINNQWLVRKSEILAGKKDNDILGIVGSYYADEKNNSKYVDMGLARAENAKLLMLDQLEANNIKTSSKLLVGSMSDRSEDLAAFSFKWSKNPNSSSESVEILDDEVLFRFPYKSTEKLNDSGINDYLLKLSEQLNTNNQKVYLEGHTDSKGTSRGNKVLGLERAEAIKATLVEMGVNSSRIIASSKGEEEPIASEDTEEGKAANRRVSLKVE